MQFLRGTVGDGKLKIVLAHDDTVFCMVELQLRGQKAKPDRIIVCSDGVAPDELRKTMIIQTAPPEYMHHNSY